ncbi:MAG: ribonuclease R [Rhodospirillaceae bacterium]|nr:ribonuclease R [Rhodospirillaceae bacterium]
MLAKTTAPFPSREEILEFIQESPQDVGKREIARAFGMDAEQKRLLKKILRELHQDGTLRKGRGRRFGDAGRLPEVTLVQISRVDDDGDLFATPMNWEIDDTPPAIVMAPEPRGRPALGVGDQVLVRLTPSHTGYRAKTIRRISAAPAQILGIFEKTESEDRIRPTNRRDRGEFIVQAGDGADAQPGELVRAAILPGKHLGLRRAKVVERLENMDDPNAISLIAIHQHDIPYVFPPDAEAEAESANAAPIGAREDLRAVPLVTIDGADARDFDDAVWAEPDPGNHGGWHCLVAIADVSWYVRPRSGLDIEARKRGNSVYFPDRVVPMLPEALSNGWCSLVPGEDRPCLAVHFWIDANGHLVRHKFVRGLMRSAARLTYEQVQQARDGDPDELTATLLQTVIDPLYGAFEALDAFRCSRNALQLELSERQVILGEDGSVAGIRERDRLDSHKLIEEFMVTANVAAAEALEKRRLPCMYRIHDQPSAEKIEALSQFLASLDLRFSKGQTVKPIQFNQILKKVADTPQRHMVSEVVLRSQAQAEYNPENIGHFGLALRRYCHFTSPIRRYADLVVHRALIAGLDLGDGGTVEEFEELSTLGEELSTLERRASAAERDAVDRYTARYLANRIGGTFDGRINGVTRAGLFVTLEETGADGLVPIRSLPDDYYVHDDKLHSLVGRRSGRTYRLGQSIDVMLMEAVPVTGGMIFNVLDAGAPPPRRRNGPVRGTKPKPKGRSRSARRKARARSKST